MGRRLAVALAGLVLWLAAPAWAQPMLEIDGGGSGHGVGMSQYGADGMALHGSDYRAILAHYYTGTALGQAPDDAVRVLLMSARSSVSFTGATRAASTALHAAGSYTVHASGGALLLGARRYASPLIVAGSGIVLRGTALNGIADGRYRGRLELVAQGGGVEVINEVRLEDYVRGVVAEEAVASWPLAALEAQAVASRTFALTGTAGAGGFDVYADTRSQLYGGVTGETAATNVAVADTTGQIVTYAGKPAATYFFTSSGGETEDIQYAFPGAAPQPWLVGVPDPYDSVAPEHRWGPLSFTLAQAQARLGGLVRGSLEAIDVTRRGFSPRVVSATVVGTAGSTAVSGPQLEAAFGLDSTWACFTVTDASGDSLPGWDDACNPGLSAPGLGATGATGGGAQAP
jgi:stage II sporulation protein D